jgi:hypothetical protein
MLAPDERDRMMRRWRDIQDELERIEELQEEDELAAARVDALEAELEQLEMALYPDDAERRRVQGRSERD